MASSYLPVPLRTAAKNSMISWSQNQIQIMPGVQTTTSAIGLHEIRQLLEPTKMWRIAEDGATKSALQETLEICKRLCEDLASMTGTP